MSELDAAETMAQALLEITGKMLDQGEMAIPLVVHGAVRLIKLQKAEIDRAHTELAKAVGTMHELEFREAKARAELARLRARLSDLHDVPPEHESEPLPFHRGWELAVRAVAK